jgi:signal transduction histidine kinase
MCLRLLTADPPNVSAAIEAAQGIVSDGKRASDIIARLRSLFARKGGTREMLDLNSVAREVVALSSNAIQRSRVVLREELAGDLPQIVGDRIELQQVIMNLLLNACDAMRGVEDRTRAMVLRTQRDDGGGVRLSLQDAGVGIEPQNEDRVFEPFYTTKDGGMGIGLSISRSIIERHGGRLWACSNEGHGATFSFVIPPRMLIA